MKEDNEKLEYLITFFRKEFDRIDTILSSQNESINWSIFSGDDKSIIKDLKNELRKEHTLFPLINSLKLVCYCSSRDDFLFYSSQTCVLYLTHLTFKKKDILPFPLTQELSEVQFIKTIEKEWALN